VYGGEGSDGNGDALGRGFSADFRVCCCEEFIRVRRRPLVPPFSPFQFPNKDGRDEERRLLLYLNLISI